MPLLELKDLTVSYGRIEAVRGISLTVEEGELVTLIGANGAGKTTTMRAISGIRQLSRGSVWFDGKDISRMKAHERVLAGIVQAPDGSVWKVATSAKKDRGPATREIDDIVLLLGVADVKASKRFYAERGLGVKRSFGGKYAEFEAAPGAVQLAIYPRHALEKETGVALDPAAAYGIVLGGGGEAFTDPDGFTWQAGDHGTHDRDEQDR